MKLRSTSSPSRRRHLGFAAAISFHAIAAQAHPSHEDVPASMAPEPAFFLAQAGPMRGANTSASTGKKQNQVTITIEGDDRVIKSNGWPDHAPGAFPRRGNPHTASPQDYTFRVPLKPQVAETPSHGGGWFFAVALNGVPFEPGTGETWNNNPAWRYEANTGFLDLGLDEHNAHVQPTGAYHYHALPTGLVARLGGDGKKMLLIGWAADGFPLYTAFAYTDAQDAKSPLRKMKSSYQLKKGQRPNSPGGPGGRYDGRFMQDWEFVKGSGDLDEFNGRTGVTPEFPQGTYYYQVSNEFPFIARQWRGTPDSSFAKAGGPPGGGPRGNGPLAGGGPFGGPGALGGMPGGGGPGGRQGMGGPGERPPPPPIITAIDANGDGEIDAREMEAATAALRSLDKNHDGKLSPDEFQPPGFPGGRPPPGGPGADNRRRGPR